MFSQALDWLFSTDGFLPHEFCLTGDGRVAALNLISDLAIAAAYFSIPVFLVILVLRRRDITIPGTFLLFSAFILLCGFTHVIEVVTYWKPVYVLQGMTKAATAFASLATAFTLWPLLPRLLAAASPMQLRDANLFLAEELRSHAEIETGLVRFNAELERHVAERTADLTRINAELEAEIAENRRIARELALARDQAEQASKVKSMFLAAMSHDLRTPLNAIIGFSDTILCEAFGPLGHPRYLGYVEDIHRSGNLLLSLINNILDLSKIEAGKREIAPGKLDAAALTRACLRLVRSEIETKRLSVEVSVDPSVEIEADDLAFRQVLLNLLSNAIKFTPREGQLAIRVRPAPGGGALVEVADTGIGMSDDCLHDALEPFGKLGAMTARREGAGSGLGLSIVARLMGLHGGSFAIDSAPGKGTTARLVFPPAARRVA
ncbi:MAG TPA: ATP-binding protein [Aliidongia sp.]|uniref:sensor histidine kinase n=1 Tax=Aliidongia sp. TaxID=1914230 RepID=UPI002DDDAB80|nr:ATP-binding protein [Aliidongia sp.]HEV2672985.1 ATP-binding protein [Aliidongia sp.]